MMAECSGFVLVEALFKCRAALKSETVTILFSTCSQILVPSSSHLNLRLLHLNRLWLNCGAVL
jgi:hypothetical protein